MCVTEIVNMRPTQTNPADDDIDAMEGQTSSALLGDKKVKPQQEIPLCGCISIQYYQPVRTTCHYP